MIHFFTSSRYKISKDWLSKQAESHISTRNYSTAKGVNVIFIGTRKMKQVANEYLNLNVAKPVLTFKIDSDDTFGEIYICYPQAVLLAAERNKTVQKMLSTLIHHGLDNLFMKLAVKGNL